MVVMQPKLQREDLVVEYQMKANQQKVLHVLNTVICWAHLIYGVPEIVVEFVKISGDRVITWSTICVSEYNFTRFFLESDIISRQTFWCRVKHFCTLPYKFMSSIPHRLSNTYTLDLNIDATYGRNCACLECQISLTMG